jgi:hydroxyethylthiazole kinase
MTIPRCLTIAGSDSGGGAGIQADLKAFAAAGCYGMSAIVALTAQNTQGVTEVHEVPPAFVRAQLEAVLSDIGVDGAKTGMLFSRRLIEAVADYLTVHRAPLVVDPVLVASSGAKLLQDDAVEALVSRLFPLATVVTPNLNEAEALAGPGSRRELAERLHELGAPAAIVTGGHGDDPVDHLFDGTSHVEIPVDRHDVPATHGAGRGGARSHRDRPRRGSRRRVRPQGRGMTLQTGAHLRELRARKPLVHQITNYVVMNETANATLALGALPVMAHATEEVEEMASVAGALVLNIGTLSQHWIEAMLLAAKAANANGVPIVLDPVGAGATTLRTETAKRILDQAEIAVVRGNAAEVATLAGREAEIRGVESIGAAGSGAELAQAAARALGTVAAVTGPVDHVSDGEQVIAVSNGHELLGTVSGTGCMATAVTGCFLAVRPDAPLEAAAEALVAFGLAGEDAAEGAKGPGTFHAQLYDALYNLNPETIDGRARTGEAARVGQ